ncbi:ATP-binding protein, partial [Streptomyces jumonjinensis]|uniref:ATP-binding protein n=1 Tax=Streptomyces jumonjinensis TaxID=1945 RepID=UPI003792FDD2
DPDACAEICRRLDGLPLAIELAAARLRLLTPRQIADRLDDRFRLLTTGSRTALPRQQTLRAVVDWSWDLLEPTERTVLRRLSVFTGGCALAQAEAVCGPDTLGALAALVDKSLVVAAPDGPDGMRYRLLETVAEYAAARLDEAGERTAAERRHLAVYRELLRGGDAELRGPRQAEWTARFETEHDNARTALRTAVRLRDEQEGLCLVLSMSWFWQQRGDQADARVWASATGALGPDPFAAPLRPAGPLPGRCTDTPPPWSGERLWEARRGVRLIMLASAGVEDTALDGRWEGEPQDYLRRIVAAYRPGLPQLRGQPGSMWFFARLMTGGLNGLAETADAMVAACDDPDGDGDGGWELAFALLMRARLRPGAGDDADRALALFDRTGDLWGYAEALSARGEAHEREGRYEEAAADYEGALRGAARVGAHRQLPVFKARLAFLRLRTAADDQERAQAERRLLDVVEASDGHTVEVVGTGRMLLVRHYGATGRTGPARGQLALMERELHETAPGLFRGLLTGLDAWLDCLDGRWDRARAGVRAALGHLDSLAYLISPQLIADQFLCAAWALAHPADTAGDGARLLGAYDAVERHPGGLGFQPFDDEREVRLSAERDLRAALGDRAYEQAYEEGRGLALRDAAALI